MSKLISKLFIAMMLLAIMPVVCAGQCDCNDALIKEPNYKTATVDGDDSEWDTSEGSDDFFGNMSNAGKEGKLLLSKAYMRYDCNKKILYFLVLVEDNEDYLDSNKPEDHYVKLGCNQDVVVGATDENNIKLPLFKYIYNGTKIIGWEASAIVEAGEYDCNVHTQVYPDDTSAFLNRCIKLNICCPIPEFPTISLPIAAIMGIMFILQNRRKED